jgi:thiol-disulfide isomerase/thioredoxin
VTDPSTDPRRRALLGAAVALPFGAGAADTTAGPLPTVGGKLRLADLPLLDGGTFRAGSAEGKVLVLYWWASWCPFCAVQTPAIQKLWDAHRAKGLLVLGISVDSKPEAAREYLAKRQYTFPSTFNTPQVERVVRKPGKALPITSVRGRGGRIELLEQGQIFAEDVEQISRFL